MLGLAAEFRQPLAHGVFRPPPRDHPRLHHSVGARHAANGMARGTPGRHAKVEHRWNLRSGHGVASEKKRPTCSVGSRKG